MRASTGIANANATNESDENETNQTKTKRSYTNQIETNRNERYPHRVTECVHSTTFNDILFDALRCAVFTSEPG